MNKNVLGIIITVVALGGIGAIVATNQKDKEPATSSSSSQSSTTTDQSATDMPMQAPAQTNSSQPAHEFNAIDIKDFAFTPTTLKVKKGTTVTWTNQDTTKHDITPDNPSEDFKASELLGKGEKYSFTFDTLGTYTYYCSPHPYMKGTIEVTE